MQVTCDLSWTLHTTATVKRAQKRLDFIRMLRKAALNRRPLTRLQRTERAPCGLETEEHRDSMCSAVGKEQRESLETLHQLLSSSAPLCSDTNTETQHPQDTPLHQLLSSSAPLCSDTNTETQHPQDTPLHQLPPASQTDGTTQLLRKAHSLKV